MTDIARKLEAYCRENNIKVTDQRRVIARVVAESNDHPIVEKVFARAREIDPNVSIATTYRTVKLLEEAGIIAKHDFGDGKSRYESVRDEHHDHLINIQNGEVIEFYDEELEKLKTALAKKLGYKLIDHRLELYAIPLTKEES